MYFLVLGLGLLLLKYNELGPVADWHWWAVLAPFGLAVVWWAWADWSGLTKARVAAREEKRDTLFLPMGHDAAHAERLRAIGWRTVAALGEGCEPGALGCTHRLEDGEAVRIAD